MKRETKLAFELLCAWAGPVFLGTFVISFMLLGMNLPAPPSPMLDAETIAARIADNLGSLRLGWVTGLIFISFYMPWSAQISQHMARIEGDTRTMTYLQLIGGALTVFVVSFAILCWSIATFRPDRPPELQQMLTDFGWLSLETQWALTTMQMWAMAFIGLSDTREKPLWPKWVCWLSIWCGFSFLPASMTQYLKTGAFAWDGMLSFYIPYAAWLVWCLVISWYMIGDVRRRIGEAEADV